MKRKRRRKRGPNAIQFSLFVSVFVPIEVIHVSSGRRA
jgi:hypothetical protein